jgi:ferredoxin
MYKKPSSIVQRNLRKIWVEKGERSFRMPAKVNKDKCTACGTCVEECPVEAIVISEEEGCAVVDEEECVDCGACEEACPAEAIKCDKEE